MEYQRAPAATAFSKKLSNGHSFNGKNMYDGVFGGGQSKVGSRVEDYAEIFGGGSGASIPVLDVPELTERKFSVDVSSSKLDYSKIFGGFGDFDFAVSHEEFIAKPTRDIKTKAKTRSISEGSFSYPSNIPVENQVLLNDQTSHESSNGVKQFKMSYNKSIPGSQNRTNGTTHVAQLQAVPGYSCLIDEKVTPPRYKPASSVMNETKQTNNRGERLAEGIHKRSASNVAPIGVNKETAESVDGLHSKSRSYGSDFNDVLFGSYDVGLRTPPTKVQRASSMSNNIGSNKHDSMKFGVSRSHSLDCDAGVSSPPYFDDEVDANSVAATSAAAVKKAIEEAQAKLKIAKELMQRRKEGHVTTRIKPSSNGGLKAEKRKKGEDTVKENIVRQDKAQETCEKIEASVQTSAGVWKQNMIKVGQVIPESEDSEKSFTAREAAGGTYAKTFRLSQADCRQEDIEKKEVTKEAERGQEAMHALNEDEGGEKKTAEKPEKYSEESVVEEAIKEEIERKVDETKELCGKVECLNELKSDVESHDQKEDETKLRFSEQFEETQEKVAGEPEACDGTLKEPEKQVEDGIQVEMQELKDIDDMETRKVAQGVDNMEIDKHRLKQEENGSGLEDVLENEENEMVLPDVAVQKEFENRSEEAFEMSSELKGEPKEDYGSEEGTSNGDDNEQILDEMEKPTIVNVRHNTFDNEEESQRRLEEKGDSLEDEEFMEAEENGDMFEDAYQMESAEEQKEAPESGGAEGMQKQADQNADEITQAREDALECCDENLEAADDANEENIIENIGETMGSSNRESSCQMTPEFLVNEENDSIVEGSTDDTECKETRRDSDAVEVANDAEENLAFDKAGLAESTSKLNEIEQQLENTTEAFDFDRSSTDSDAAETSFEPKLCEQNPIESEIIRTMEKHVQELAHESEEDVSEAEVLLKQEENKYKFEFPDEGRAIREARERAFAEARERAAAGRKNVEARRKVKAEAEGESAKPSAEASDKTSIEAKLKAERAAVERATAEARQRALEKALSEKGSFGSRNQAEKVSDAKQSFQSYNKSLNPKSSLILLHEASHSSERIDGATGESAQRCKARLERHQRTAERAAKALAEKNRRDLLAQKEQAERNRLAETLDAEVKRWSSGKQGNLRALLSTLQYILGPDSGWQPIPLTDIISTAAVKKAYRKATLCVHPDKLQQRGASIQQKYTCEKVFDLLKEAWNKFSAEER
ncbi:hypothetical protein CCACVL1_08940 [Corchorus capsularis]|uniref:J domain-containing protein n=1 Tax=Corchorus capsularis TaxID=210143 RepID=A0A1R3IYD6_COCAP|nr:hypothetical protein CCACVL1_08940 [Corchorus capsularis]